MPKKIREMEKLVAKTGWTNRRGKGSLRNWVHPRTGAVVTICGRAGDDCPRYLERQILKALKENP
ncbi:MAG: type II toxin-antitoxin system HicA family toxin [Chthoniobacterales bacterium]